GGRQYADDRPVERVVGEARALEEAAPQKERELLVAVLRETGPQTTLHRRTPQRSPASSSAQSDDDGCGVIALSAGRLCQPQSRSPNIRPARRWDRAGGSIETARGGWGRTRRSTGLRRGSLRISSCRPSRSG